MLGYAHINLLSMLVRFEPEEVVGVATDSLYVQKRALHKLEGVKTYSPPICMKDFYGIIKGLEDIKVSEKRREVCPAQ